MLQVACAMRCALLGDFEKMREFSTFHHLGSCQVNKNSSNFIENHSRKPTHQKTCCEEISTTPEAVSAQF